VLEGALETMTITVALFCLSESAKVGMNRTKSISNDHREIDANKSCRHMKEKERIFMLSISCTTKASQQCVCLSVRLLGQKVATEPKQIK